MGASAGYLLGLGGTLKIIFILGTVKGQFVKVPHSEASSTYREVLDPVGGLALGWRVNRSTKSVVFHVELPPTEGYVLLGLTMRQRLDGADVIMIGNGERGPYVRDMHSVNNGTLRLDAREDWKIIGVDNEGYPTVVHIRRDLDTCDPQDIPIKGELIDMVWDYGDNDSRETLPTQLQPRGLKHIFFQDPMTLPITINVHQIQAEAKVWRLRRRHRLPTRYTSYWCSIYKMPSLSKRHHIVGVTLFCDEQYSVYFDSELSRRHVHHHLMYRCSVPPTMSAAAVFEPFLNYPGEDCYLNANPQLPSYYCREFVHVFNAGGETVMFPETMGIQIGEAPVEYFLFEAHYNNPEERADLEVVSGVDMFYSPQLRPNKGSILMVGYGTMGTFVVPPNASGFQVAGHCGKACTALMLGLSSTKILGVSLHSHTAGRKIRLRHFRGMRELPWIQDDQDYHFDYQQFRFHPEPVTLLPGDHLTVQCTYDITDRNGSAIAYGPSTKDEMCLAFLILDKRVPSLLCISEYPTLRTMARFGILNMTWDADLAERVVNAAFNPRSVGRTLSQVVAAHTEWTPERVQELEDAQMYQGHGQSCPPWGLVGMGLQVASLFRPVRDIYLAKSRPSLSTLETTVTIPLTVKFPSVTTAYFPPSCQV